MFGWLFKKEEIKEEEIRNIVFDILDILKRLSEAFVIGAISSLKTYSPELKNKNWKFETLNDSPELECALLAFQVKCVCSFFIRHKINVAKPEGLNKMFLIQQSLLKIKHSRESAETKMIMKYSNKYSNEEDGAKRKNLVTDDVIKLMKFPEISEPERLRRAMLMTVKSMEAQVYMELANYFDDRKLADQYMLKAGKGLDI